MTRINKKSYEEVMSILDFEDRLEYLKTNSTIGDLTFGSRRAINQAFYRSKEWKDFKRKIILRDNGCDLGHPDYPIIGEPMIVHHINPVTLDDILEGSQNLLDPKNAITTRDLTHKRIHYERDGVIKDIPYVIDRVKGDTDLW